MKRNYKILLSYEGTRYSGWQKQVGSLNTIQGKLEDILTKLSGESIQVVGSGRTDAGVHAIGQVANFHLDTELSPGELQNYFNQYLPEDIAITSVKIASDRFHSRLNALEKTYCYRLYTGDSKPVFNRKFVHQVTEDLDLESMKQAAAGLTGNYDFAAFCGINRMKKSTVRTIFEIDFRDLRKQEEELHIIIRGNGFLHHMVRIITGTLLEVGLGLREADSMQVLINEKDRSEAGFLAPAKGLILLKVDY